MHKLPVIFFCQNNKYAISVPLKKQMAVDSVAKRAVGYGFAGVSVDGNDPLEVYRVVKEARERALRGEGPTLIEAVVNRLVPHSSDDDDRTYVRGRSWRKRRSRTRSRASASTCSRWGR